MRIVTIALIFYISKRYSAKTSLRILGGRDAKPGEFPYVVRLEIEIKGEMHDFCTGSVIKPAWTLTAAHCMGNYHDNVKNEKLNYKYVVRYGSVLEPPGSENTFSNIIAGFKHPSFHYSSVMTHDSLQLLLRRHYMRNDIGLFKTDPISLPEYGKLSTISYSALKGLEVVAAGHGLTNTTSGDYNSTLVLKKPLQIVNFLIKTCTNLNYKIYPELCMSSPCSYYSYTIYGDSGGPAIHGSGVIGIVHGGENGIGPRNLDETYKPPDSGYFTPVSPFIDWIVSYINK